MLCIPADLSVPEERMDRGQRKFLHRWTVRLQRKPMGGIRQSGVCEVQDGLYQEEGARWWYGLGRHHGRLQGCLRTGQEPIPYCHEETPRLRSNILNFVSIMFVRYR